MRRLRPLRLLAIVALAAACLGGGLAGHAATTTTVPPEYAYDDPAAFVLGADSSRPRPASQATIFGAGPHDLATLRLRESVGVAAKGASKLVEGARYPLSPKIQGQLAKRGWTTEAIDEAVQSGKQIRAVNKATENPATRYIHPNTGQSVVIDDLTGQVIHVGGPGFKYGPGSGDLP